MSSTDVEAHVLANAGARPADRDSVDTEIISWATDGDKPTSAQYPRINADNLFDSQDDRGSWPILAENTRPLTLPNNPNGDDDGDGYTNLEEWLHTFAAEVEGSTEDPPIASLLSQP